MKKIIILLAIALVMISMVSGAIQPKVKDVREKHESELFAIEGVSGVSVDEVNNAIIVYVEKSEHSEKVPKKLDGFPVKFKVTGKIEALKPAIVTQSPITLLATAYSRTGIQRPVFGGISIGPPQTTVYISAGTLGLITKDNYILSNAHVIAMNEYSKFLPIGTATLQPGTIDGGTGNDQIGTLYNYIPIRFNSYRGNNYADAAISTLTADGYKGFILNETNDGFYTINGTSSVINGDVVRKSGRTSGVTSNTVVDTQASVKVSYSGGKWAIFKDQIMVNQPFVQSGDSGSAVDKDGKFVGLLFAGSSTLGIVNKAQYIISGLGITV